MGGVLRLDGCEEAVGQSLRRGGGGQWWCAIKASTCIILSLLTTDWDLNYHVVVELPNLP